MKKLLVAIMAAGAMATSQAAPITIVAAENFYGELAREIGGNHVTVQSILSNPSEDPHLFTTSPATSKALAKAQIIIYNGANYDPWINQLLSGINRQKVKLINVADLMQVTNGANPHIWYMPQTFPKLAAALSTDLSQLNPQAKSQFQANLNQFNRDYAQVLNQISQIKSKYNKTPVTATEPVYGYMAEALGLTMHGQDFQWKIMNDSEPTPKMISNYQDLLTKKQVKVLFYNSQVSDPLTHNMQDLASKNGIAIVGVGETMPANLTIKQWLTQQLTATQKALATSH